MNDPAVRPGVTLGADMSIDITPLIDSGENLFLGNEHGGFLLVKEAPAEYSIHTQFLPSGRGSIAALAAQELLEFAFTKLDCHKLVTEVAIENRPAKAFALKAGLRPCGVREFQGHIMNQFYITKEQWINTCPF